MGIEAITKLQASKEKYEAQLEANPNDWNAKEGLAIINRKIEHIHCPVNGWDCPYYTDKDHPCRCTLPHPEEDCDDFNYFWEDCKRDEWIDDDWEVE